MRHIRPDPMMLQAQFDTGRVIALLLYDWLRVPKKLGQKTLGAIMESHFSRPKEFVASVTLACTPLRVPALMPLSKGAMMRTSFDLDALFLQKFTPSYMMDLFEDLVIEGLLTRQEATAVEDYVLAQISATGEWLEERR